MTAAQYAPAVLQAGHDLGVTPKGIVIGFATVFVESDWTMYANEGDPPSLAFPHTALSTDANSDGLFQQRDPWWGTAAQRMDAYQSAVMFFNSLKKQRINVGTEDKPIWNDYTTDAKTPGGWAQMVQQSAFPDRYDARMADAQALYNQLAAGGLPPVTAPSVDPNRPDFNEYARWSNNSEDRGGAKVDLWLIHTQEGDGNADSLAGFLISTESGPNPVSYHYTISTGYPNDTGVTVCDVVDTDQASWSVEASNDRSINLCFAGSSVSWTRDDWIARAGRAIDVAAYLCVQDCIKYGIATDVIPGPAYGKNPPGISDHRYCGQWLKDGNNHNDVGDNFPWDVFSTAVAKYAALVATPSPPPPVITSPVPATEPSGDVATRGMLEQFMGPWDAATGRFVGWPQLGKNSDGSDRSLVDGLGHVIATLDAQQRAAAQTRAAAAKKPAAKRTAPRKAGH